MGMSASQARLLTLTSRLSDLEYSAQNISNTKIRLADQTEDAATLYSEALDKQKLSVYSSDTDSYIDATAYNLSTYNAVSSLDKQRLLSNNAGQIGVSKSVADAFEFAMLSDDAQATMAAGDRTQSYNFRKNPHGGSTPILDANGKLQYYKDIRDSVTDELIQSGFEKMLGLNVQNYPDGDYDQKLVTYYTNLWEGSEDFLNVVNPGYTGDPSPYDDQGNQKGTYDPAMAQYYTNLFIEMQDHGYFVIDGKNMNDSNWLHTQLNNGAMYIKNWDYNGGTNGLGEFVNVPWQSGDTTLKQQNDDSGTARAQADYDTAMARIHSKETKLDLQLKQIDTEHTAVQTEVDSVKKIIDKNIERTFKIFDA